MADTLNISTNLTEGTSISSSVSDGISISTSVNENTSVTSNVVTGAKGDAGATGPAGPTGATGATGAQGAAGQGVPVGGTTGQVLTKNSGTNYDTGWATPSSGSSGITRTIVVTSGNTSAGSATSTDYTYLVAGAHTITLPTAVSNTNRYTIKNNHSAAITVNTTSSQTIDGTTSIQIAPEDSVDLISDNSNWRVI